MIAFSERYGHVLVCRDKDGTFLGAVGLIPPFIRDLLYTFIEQSFLMASLLR